MTSIPKTLHGFPTCSILAISRNLNTINRNNKNAAITTNTNECSLGAIRLATKGTKHTQLNNKYF
jgi:hypothetical protein